MRDKEEKGREVPKLSYSKELKKKTMSGKPGTESDCIQLDYSEGWAYVNLRIPLTMLQEIDEHLHVRRVKIPRMYWIIKAILEKMERDKHRVI